MTNSHARRWVLVATIAGVALTGRLAFWQLDRAQQKLSMQAALDARAVLPPLDEAGLARDAAAAPSQHYRPVRLRGRWVAARTVFLDNRQMDGRVGFDVVTPLRLAGANDAVLVQRGWAPRDQLDRTHVPDVPTSADEVEVVGQLAPPPSRLFEFQGSGGGAIRQNLDLDGFSIETGLSLRPLSVLQADSPATAGDGLRRHWPRPAVDVHKNYGYAFQWAAMAALMTGLYVWFEILRPRRRRGS